MIDIVARHGEPMKCPACGSQGRMDFMRLGEDKNEAEFNDAVWVNKHDKNWECYECWLK